MSQAIPGFTPLPPAYQGNLQQQQVSAALASSSSGMPGDSISPVAIGLGVTAGGLLTATAVTLAVKHFSASSDKPKPAQATSLKSVERAHTPQLEKKTPQPAPLPQPVPPHHQSTWQSQSAPSPQPSPPPLPPKTLPTPPDPASASDGTGSESDIAQTDGNNQNTVGINEITFKRLPDLPPELRGRIAEFLPGTLRVNKALDEEYRPYMKELEIRNSQDIHTDLNTVVSRFRHVKHLKLADWNDLSNADYKQIAKLTNLRYLDISWCYNVTDAVLEYLEGLNNLRHLDISRCGHVTDAGLKHLKALPNLRHLNISLLPDVTDAGLEHLKALPNLRHLYIDSYTGVTDAGIAQFRRERPQCEVEVYGR